MEQDATQSRQITSQDEATVVAALEMGGRLRTSLAEIGELIGVTEGAQRARDVAAVLRRHGWLRALPARGAYEFQPAAGGQLPSGDPWLELGVALARDPRAQAHVGLGSAAFVHGFSDRRPRPDTVVWNAARRAPDSLGSVYRVIRCTPGRFFGTVMQGDIAVASVARTALEAAMWPLYAGDLTNPEHWLPAALAAANLEELGDGAKMLGPVVTARLGYLAERFGADDAVAFLETLPRAKPVWLGPRGAGRRRFDARWGVYDNVGVGGVE